MIPDILQNSENQTPPEIQGATAKIFDNPDDFIDAEITGITTYKLEKPITVQGTTYTEFAVDLENLKGHQLKEAARLVTGLSQQNPFYEFSKDYQERVIALATKTPHSVIKELYLADWTALTFKAQLFLVSKASAGLN
jgi:hypothetical protein